MSAVRTEFYIKNGIILVGATIIFGEVMWAGVLGPRSAFASTQAFMAMVAWLENIAADTSDAPLGEKVVRDKPAGLTDGCWTGEAAPFTFIAERQFLGGPGSSTCNSLYPGFLFPRAMAGMPPTNDIVKCRLRRIDPADYKVTWSPDERARLDAIFPDGVCDYTRPGVDQEDLLSTWITYTDVGKYKQDRGDGN